MEIADYVEEAAAALDLPEELWPTVRSISFDVGDQEWYSPCHVSREDISAEANSWIIRIIGWLQFNYPQGPSFPEVSCC